MALPETELHRVNKLFTKFCEDRIPPDVRNEIRLLFNIKVNKVILIESRPYYNYPSSWTEMPIAQFEYNLTTKMWSLYGYNSNDRRIAISEGGLENLLQEVNNDSTGIFWG